MEDDESNLIRCMERRVSLLEKLVFGEKGQTTSATLSSLLLIPGNDLTNQVSILNKSWSKKEQHFGNENNLGRLSEEFARIQREVEKMEDFGLPPQAKLDIIMETSDSTLNLSQDIEKFETNKQYVNSKSFTEVDQLKKSLVPLEKIHLDQLDNYAQIDSQFHQILVNYNALVQLISEKFVFWDRLLKLAEQESSKRSR